MCNVIAVLNGIKICHKLFTPEMVVAALSIHDWAVMYVGSEITYTQLSCGLGLRLDIGVVVFHCE